MADRLRIAILGSTGSIGKTAIQIVKNRLNYFDVKLIANNSDFLGLLSQANEIKADLSYCSYNRKQYCQGREVSFNPSLLSDPETYKDIDIVINGINGLAGLKPGIAVLTAGKRLATANKESIITAGTLLRKLEREYGGIILPVDSEHSAVWQCMEKAENVRKIILTASGGAFRDYSREELAVAKAKDALKHPTWKMGKKVTIDCATLMNKGMEIIEAKQLFGINNIEVVQHRESIVHALVEKLDGNVSAVLSSPDMTLPIAYALSYPKRYINDVEVLDLVKLGSLNFARLREEDFPCLTLAKKAFAEGDFSAVVLNAANEVLVNAYLEDKIGFYDIPDTIERAMQSFGKGSISSFDDIFRIDAEVCEYTHRAIGL